MTRAKAPTKPKTAKAPTKTAKADETRAKIVGAALKLFRKHGYERTTMALVAAKAGVSKGNAYYYFKSKDELIQGFYEDLLRDHRDRARVALATQSTLEDRLRVTLFTWMDAAAPYHAFADKLFRSAASPTSPLSPFSADSSPARNTAVALMAEVLAGAVDLDVSDASDTSDQGARALLQEVPRALWLLHMALVALWVFDRSPSQEKTRAAAGRIATVAATAVQLAASPLFEGMRGDAVAILREVAGGLQI